MVSYTKDGKVKFKQWGIYDKAREGSPLTEQDIISIVLKIINKELTLGNAINFSLLGLLRRGEGPSGWTYRSHKFISLFKQAGYALPIRMEPIKRKAINGYEDEEGNKIIVITSPKLKQAGKRNIGPKLEYDEVGNPIPQDLSTFSEQDKKKLEKYYIELTKTVTRTKDIEYIMDPTLPNYPLLKELVDYCELCDRGGMLPDDPLFPGITYKKIYHALRKEGITPHLLRRLQANFLQNYGFNLFDIKASGGWKNLGMVEVYCPSSKESRLLKFKRYIDTKNKNKEKEDED